MLIDSQIFNDAGSTAEDIQPIAWTKMEMLYKGVVMACFKVISENSTKETEETHEDPRSRKPYRAP
jgi:hypothetical protein